MISREKPMSKSSIVNAYFGAVLLTAIVVIASWLQHEPATIIFQKSLVAPLFLLAGTGLRAFFPERFGATRGTLATAEFHLLEAAVLAAFLLLVLHPLGDLGQQLTFFAVFVLLVGSAKFLLAMRAKRKIRHHGKRSTHLTDL